VRILLASQEANALQALGDLAGADAALTRARRARDELASGKELGSAWACEVAPVLDLPPELRL
jgi:hypothetical protein